SVAWDRLFAGGGRRVPLPTYAFQRERYWVDTRDTAGARGRTDAGTHPLLGEGRTVSTATGVRTWETTLAPDHPPWLSDHQVQGGQVLPGAAYLEMAISAGAALFDRRPVDVTGVLFVEPLAFSGEPAVRVQVVTTEEQPGRARFQIASQRAGA